MSDPMEYDPATALAALQDARAAWATRPDHKGRAYDVGYGLVTGVMVGGQALFFPFNLVASLSGSVMLAVAGLYFARRHGVWINGAGPRRARWVAIGFGLLFILAAGATFWAGSHGMAWIGWPAGLAAGLLGMAAARLWRWVYRSDIADNTDTQSGGIGHRPFGLLAAFGLAIVAGTSIVAYLTRSLESSWFFYALGAGLGVTFASLIMALVQRLVLRRA